MKTETVTTIEKRRTELGWSQGELAMFVGVSIPSVSFWESRKRRSSRPAVKLLSRLLGVNMETIESDYAAQGEK